MISVIIPAYNLENYIERCVNSILAQTYTDFEILLVDDGSTDGTGAICDMLASRDGRVRVFHKENGGVSSARNLALDNLKGDYISVIDGDDWVEPNLFSDCMQAIHEHKAQAVMFEYFVDRDNKIEAHSVAPDNYGLLTAEGAISYTVRPYNRFCWSKIFAASLLKDLRFDDKIILGEDTLFIVEILSRADSVYYMGTPYYHYVVREGSAVQSKFNLKKLSGLLAYKGQMEICTKHGYSVATDYAREALVSLAVAIAVRASSTADRKDKAIAYRVTKSYIMPEVRPLLKSGRVTKKAKVKALGAVVSIRLTCVLCRIFGN